MFNVVDANGKSFEFSIEQLQDMNSNLFNHSPHSVSTEVDLKDFCASIFDEDGNELGKVGDVSNILDSQSSLPKALRVSIETTHSGDNHNYAIYHSDSMEKDCASFMAPYKKPLIKNHDSRTEPLGRVEFSTFKESEICPERDTILVDFVVNDKDAIEKFLDGRYRTVSVGGSVGHIKCNICGKDVLKDKKVKFCGHWKGEKYGDNVALWHMRDIKYNECSIVNNPADDWAQVVKIVALNDSTKEEAKDEAKDEVVEKSNMMDNQSNDLSIIDELLDNNEEVEETTELVEDSEEVTTEEETTEVEVTDEVSEVDKLVDEINSLKELNKELTDKVNEKDNLISNLQIDSSSMQNELEDAKKDLQQYRQTSIRLANLNKKLLVDKLLLLSSDLVEDELKEKTASELNSMVDEIIKNKDKHSIADVVQVTNPGLANQNDNYAVVENDEDEVEENVVDNDDNAQKQQSVMNSIINNLFK